MRGNKLQRNDIGIFFCWGVKYGLADYEKRKKEAVEREAQESGDKAKIEEAKVTAAQHQQRMDNYKKQVDELTKKFSEAQKNAKPQ